MRFVKKSPIVKFDTEEQCIHSLLRTDGIYFYVHNDTIFPNIYYKFNDDKSVIRSYDTGMEPADRGCIYKVVGDTIFLQDYYGPMGMNRNWSYYIKTFVIESDSSICQKKAVIYYDDYVRSNEVNKKFMFYPMTRPIVATVYQDIRRYKWMWKDKKNWKHWMETHKR